jgi:hypothetical protein
VSGIYNFASYFGMTSGATWVQGDFNYDGRVDVTDLSDFANEFGKSLSATGAATATAAGSVPEPAGLITLHSVAGFGVRRPDGTLRRSPF